MFRVEILPFKPTENYGSRGISQVDGDGVDPGTNTFMDAFWLKYFNYSQVSQITYTRFARQTGPLLNDRKLQGSSLQGIMTASRNWNRQRSNKRYKREERKQGVPARVEHVVT